MYLHLFNAVTDSLHAILAEKSRHAFDLLTDAQQSCEEFYMRALEHEADTRSRKSEPLPTEDPDISIYDFSDYL